MLSSSRGQKRRKIGLACVECRERKRKCDGERPCGNCRKRNSPAECVYTDESLKRGSSGYVESLRTRIKELEKQIGTQKGSPPIETAISNSDTAVPYRLGFGGASQTSQSTSLTFSGPVPSPLSAKAPLTSPSSEQPRAPTSSFHQSLLRDESSASLGSDASPQDNDYLGIGAMGLPGAALCYYCQRRRVLSADLEDSTSTTAFDRQVQEWVQGQSSESDIPPQQTRPVEICRCWAGRRMKISRSAMPGTLPDRTDADTCVSNYFDSVYCLYPYILRPVFMQHYEQIWQSAGKEQQSHISAAIIHDSNIFFCQLNAILALGTQFASGRDAKWKASMGDLYYRRILQSLNLGLMERGSLELVQTLILTAQYLQTTQLWEMCWNFAGLAIRVAMGIGLHVTSPESERVSQEASFVLEESMRRRAWAGCVALDRLLAILYGKPLMLPPTMTRNFIHNLPHRSDESIMANRNITYQRPHQIEFFTHSLKMLHYIGDILELQNTVSHANAPETKIELGPNAPRILQPFTFMTGEHLQKMLKLDATLVELNAQIPSHLQISVAMPGTLFGKQATVLRTRHLHLRVYLLRAILLDVYRLNIRPKADPTLQSISCATHNGIITTMAITCLDQAMALIDLIRNDNRGDQDPANLWWYEIYYAYFCATVIHAGRLCTRSGADIQDDNELQQSFQKCLLYLRKYEAQTDTAKTCRRALELLEQRAFPNERSSSLAAETATSDEGSTALWPTDTTYPGGMDTAFDPFVQYGSQSGPYQMYGGITSRQERQSQSGAAGASRETAVDVDNYFWTAFRPGPFPGQDPQ